MRVVDRLPLVDHIIPSSRFRLVHDQIPSTVGTPSQGALVVYGPVPVDIERNQEGKIAIVVPVDGRDQHVVPLRRRNP